MKYQKLVIVLGLCGLCIATASHAKSFLIEVSANGQPAFTDCLVFEDEHRLQFTRGSIKLAWISDPSAAEYSAITATTDGANVDTKLRLTLHAGIYAGRFIVGNAVNSFGKTYMFMGRAESCGPKEALALPGDANYAALPVETFAPVRVAPASRPDLTAWIGHDQPCSYPGCQPLQPPKVARPDLTAWMGNDEPCFGFDCGPPPQPQAGDTPGQASVVSGGSFKVYLQAVPKTGKPIDDCWVFENTGTLRNGLGAELLWRMDRYNTDEKSFQSVATLAATHGTAFHGRANNTGQMTVTGIRAVAGKVIAYSGYAFPVRGC